MLKTVLLLIILSFNLFAKEDKCKNEIFKFSFLEKTSELACKDLSSDENFDLKELVTICECANELSLLLNQIEVVNRSCQELKGWNLIKNDAYTHSNLVYKKFKAKCEALHK